MRKSFASAVCPPCIHAPGFLDLVWRSPRKLFGPRQDSTGRQAEYTLSILCRGTFDGAWIFPTDLCQLFCHEAHMARIIPFAAVRNWGHVRTVCLNEKTVKRYCFGSLERLFGVFEREPRPSSSRAVSTLPE